MRRRFCAPLQASRNPLLRKHLCVSGTFFVSFLSAWLAGPASSGIQVVRLICGCRFICGFRRLHAFCPPCSRFLRYIGGSISQVHRFVLEVAALFAGLRIVRLFHDNRTASTLIGPPLLRLLCQVRVLCGKLPACLAEYPWPVDGFYRCPPFLRDIISFMKTALAGGRSPGGILTYLNFGAPLALAGVVRLVRGFGVLAGSNTFPGRINSFNGRIRLFIRPSKRVYGRKEQVGG